MKEETITVESAKGLDTLKAQRSEVQSQLEQLLERERELNTLVEFFELWYSYMKSHLNDRLQKHYGDGFKVESIEAITNHSPIMKIEFNFTSDEIEDFNRFDFENDVVKDLLETINHDESNIHVFPNTQRMGKGYTLINVRVEG